MILTRMFSTTTAVVLLACLLALAQPSTVHAETKVITTEATYTMGDGETPSLAEAQVLQRAKQIALEQAGTYVESYTKVHNLDLTTDEIQTIAGGVLEVEVLEKTRNLVGDGLRFFIKIKATVTTDKMEDLARRIKGKNVAEEYQKLQAEYVRLSGELETWKQLAAKTPQGPERDAALDQIREREHAFARTQKNEAALFQRLVSGRSLVATARNTQIELNRLIEAIKRHGHQIEIGKVAASPIADNPNEHVLTVPVTVRISDTLPVLLSDTAMAFGGEPVLPAFKLYRRVRDSHNSTRNEFTGDPVALNEFSKHDILY